MYRIYEKEEFYTKKAREEGYPARSVYKLQEIDEKFHMIKKGDKVLDLGAAPGSWLLYLSKKMGNAGKIVGIDIADIKIKEQGNIIFLKKDVLNLSDKDLAEIGAGFDAVVSDLAPFTSGVKDLDVGRSLELSYKALDMVKKCLRKGGNFVCKVFEGEATNEFFKEVEEKFQFVKRFRAKAVHKGSKEFYIVAKNFL